VHSLGVFIQNAIQRADSHVLIECSENDTAYMIQISDDGPGFDIEIISSLGHPLKSFRPDGHGEKRLGIFIAQNLLEELGARTVYSNDMETGGAIVAIHWAKDKIAA
jgi:two-component system sensor histidine kinase RegB